MVELRRKHQQDKEKEKLDAIENKIENARKRLEEKKKIKSENAKNTVKRRTAPAGGQQHHQIHQKNNYMESDDDGAGPMDNDNGLGLYIRSQNNRVRGESYNKLNM